MKIENIPADIKSKSLKEARDEIDEILIKLENEKENSDVLENEYKRLIILNKHVENIFKKKTKEISDLKEFKIND
tara:strand:- start:814 stop:1038 length:225 start_codon:yes stop_codon:yes gene_type:complete